MFRFTFTFKDVPVEVQNPNGDLDTTSRHVTDEMFRELTRLKVVSTIRAKSFELIQALRKPKSGKSKGRIVGWEVTCLQKNAAELKRKLTSSSDGLKLFEVPAELRSERDQEDSDTPSSTESSSKPGTPAPDSKEEKPDELMLAPPTEKDMF